MWRLKMSEKTPTTYAKVDKDKKRAEYILDRWSAELKEMDRSRENVQSNFEVLIVNLSESKIGFDIAHEILDKAIVAHYPPKGAVDNTYRRLKPMISKSKDEFLSEWKENIKSAAKRAFYTFYDIDGEKPIEDKKYGSMSTVEYTKQRKYADSHPLLDWTNIELKPIEPGSVNE